MRTPSTGSLTPLSDVFLLPNPPRDARLIAATELRQWELETEQAPPDALRFWKMAAHGGVHATTVPGALFPTEQTGQQQAEGEDQQEEQQEQEEQKQQRATGAKNATSKQQVSAPVGGNRSARRAKDLPVKTTKGKELNSKDNN